jgi:hypothetical protein
VIEEMENLTKGSSMAKVIGVICLAVVLTLASVACSGGTETTPTPTATATPAPTPTPTATPRPTQQPLFLNVTTPEDESIVATSEVEVAGTTLPTAIVSVNGTLVTVEVDGAFSTTVTLEEGPNTIEVVASTVKGEELDRVLMVMYIP